RSGARGCRSSCQARLSRSGAPAASDRFGLLRCVALTPAWRHLRRDAGSAYDGEVSWCPPNLMHELHRLDVGCPDHLGPFLGFFGYEFSEVSGQSGINSRTSIGEPCFQARISKPRIDFSIEPLDDPGGCVLGRANAEPVARFVPGNDVAYRRDIEQR